jgi:hypothetical protein
MEKAAEVENMRLSRRQTWQACKGCIAPDFVGWASQA